MITEIQKVNPNDIVFTGEYADDYNFAKITVQSAMFPTVKSVSQGMVKIQIGKELGLNPFQSLMGVYTFITGGEMKIQIGGNVIASRIKRTGKYDYRVLESNEKVCKIQFLQDSKVLGDYSYTIEMASKANLLTKANWKSYPKDMLFNRAVSGGYKMFCPDIFSLPVYTEADIPETTKESYEDVIQNELESVEYVDGTIITEPYELTEDDKSNIELFRQKVLSKSNELKTEKLYNHSLQKVIESDKPKEYKDEIIKVLIEIGATYNIQYEFGKFVNYN